MDHTEQLLQALGYFKDWTNYLLVTTVAALGWVATKPLILGKWSTKITLLCFCASIVFAIFTLALIPIVGESITTTDSSFYNVEAKFKLLLYWVDWSLTLKAVCWWQHVFFLGGIVAFTVGGCRGGGCPIIS